MTRPWLGLGMMSGTSLDGIDLAYCSFQESDSGRWSFEIIETATLPYSESWRERLDTLQNQSAEEFARTHSEYGHLLGETAARFLRDRRLTADFVASHGQTIFHQPEQRFTSQIGDGETMAAHLPCPLITNFRVKDVALGGQGAPLVPFGERLLFPECSLFLNLGGFANLTAGPIAFDVSPCNYALNWAARRHDPALDCDRDGTLARAGNRNEELFKKLEALPYYHQSPPKSLGREWFEENFLPPLHACTDSSPNLLRTLSDHIASQVGKALDAARAREGAILVSGGGFRNAFLAEQLQTVFRERGIALHSKVDANLIDYKEALIFALLGLHTLLGRPNILPSVTGASHASASGSIHLPGRPDGRPLPRLL